METNCIVQTKSYKLKFKGSNYTTAVTQSEEKQHKVKIVDDVIV